MGLPCKHICWNILENSETLLPNMFDRHWWIREDLITDEKQPARVLEPTKLRPKRTTTSQQKTKAKGTGPNGTRREPSRFEFSDPNHPASLQNIPTTPLILTNK